jgi:3,4-dihydroxy 2-butanone 4-phosphate synthase/GTP cyclohydrolase II
MTLASPDTLLEDIRQGKMVILVDDEDRENEGDIVIAADAVTPEQVNFMARYARGLICLALTRQRVEELGLPLMAQHNGTRHQTAFTVSIEAREGVTTGISAADRARTINVASNPDCGRSDIVTPGHIFPLMARDGGVLVRAGHTEAGVDLARLAGRTPAAVICEIMNDDGSMARLPDLQQFAAVHGLNIGSIADLIAWRRRREVLVERLWQGETNALPGGTWSVRLYRNILSGVEHLALVKGIIAADTPVPVRMHTVNVWDDMVASPPNGSLLYRSMKQIATYSNGVVVILREPLPNSLSRVLRKEQGADSGHLRDYGVGAQILLDAGVRQMLLLTNSSRKNIVGLEGYDLHIAGQLPIE